MAPRRLLGLVAVLVPAAAHASGVCENTGTTYGVPTLFAEATEAFAVPATLAWCEERDRGGVLDEVRGTIAFTELRDVHGKVLGVLSAARGKDAKRLEAAVGAFDKVATGKLASTLKARGYARIVPQGRTRAARCTVRAAWTSTRGTYHDGFPAGLLAVEVWAGKQRALRYEVGPAAEARRGDEKIVAHFLARRGAIALFVRRPTCAGPPPGYFGPDDPGDCYAVDEVSTTLLDAKTGDLARCFPSP